MKLALASAVLASLLLAGVRAHAQSEADPAEAVSLPVGRCLEAPMSLAIAIAEGEAARWLPQTAMSTTAVAPPPAQDTAQPGRTGVPYTPLAQLCASPDDPGCHVSMPLPSPSRVHVDALDHGFAPPPAVLLGLRPTVSEVAPPASAPVTGGPRSAHHLQPWRPPAA